MDGSGNFVPFRKTKDDGYVGFMTLFNETSRKVLYKVKSNQHSLIHITPSATGVIPPDSTLNIQLKTKTDISKSLHCCRILLQSAFVPADVSTMDYTHQVLWTMTTETAETYFWCKLDSKSKANKDENACGDAKGASEKELCEGPTTTIYEEKDRQTPVLVSQAMPSYPKVVVAPEEDDHHDTAKESSSVVDVPGAPRPAYAGPPGSPPGQLRPRSWTRFVIGALSSKLLHMAIGIGVGFVVAPYWHLMEWN